MRVRVRDGSQAAVSAAERPTRVMGCSLRLLSDGCCGPRARFLRSSSLRPRRRAFGELALLNRRGSLRVPARVVHALRAGRASGRGLGASGRRFTPRRGRQKPDLNRFQILVSRDDREPSSSATVTTGTNPRLPARASFAGRRLAGSCGSCRHGWRPERPAELGRFPRAPARGPRRLASPRRPVGEQTGRGLSALCAPRRGVTVRVGRVRIGLGRQHQPVAEPVPARVVPEDLL